MPREDINRGKGAKLPTVSIVSIIILILPISPFVQYLAIGSDQPSGHSCGLVDIIGVIIFQQSGFFECVRKKVIKKPCEGKSRVRFD